MCLYIFAIVPAVCMLDALRVMGGSMQVFGFVLLHCGTCTAEEQLRLCACDSSVHTLRQVVVCVHLLFLCTDV